MLNEYLHSIATSAFVYALIFAGLLSLEVVAPRERMGPRNRMHGLMFWAILIPLDLIVLVAIHACRSALGIEPIFAFRSEFGSAALAAIVAAVWADFTFYWFHRIQHRFLWRWHAVHHSITHLSGINSYHHWSEPLWHATVVGIPLSFVSIEAIGPAAGLAFLLRAWPYYVHSPTKLHVGWLNWLIVDNRYHRIHHSSDPAHFDRNFGALTPLWDWVCGTLHMPRPDEWPKVGIADRSEPKSILDWEALPAGGASPPQLPDTKMLPQD